MVKFAPQVSPLTRANKLIRIKFALLLLGSLAIAGCGGGTGGSASNPVGSVGDGLGYSDIGDWEGRDLAGTPRAQPNPTMGALEAII